MRALATVAFSEVERLILRAALLEGPAARDAYRELRAGFDLDALDYGRQRLLPLLHRNITSLGIDDPALGRLRGVRHYHWARNQVRVRAVAPLLAEFVAAGIPTVLLKGTALLATCLDDMSLRPMDDIDLLVPRERWRAALEVMAERGYKPRGVDETYLRTEDDSSQPGWGFFNAQGIEVDLHSYLLRLDCREGADIAAWRRIRPATLAGQATAVLCPADQILHAIAHAALWSPGSILRWAADVVLILRGAGGAMDWEPLIEEAVARRIAPPLHDGLAALRAHLGIDIPDRVLAALRRASGPIERLEHRFRAQPHEARSRLSRGLIGLSDMRRQRQSLMDRPLWASVIPYLRDRLAARDIAHLVPLLIFAALGRPWWLRGAIGVDRWARQMPRGAFVNAPNAAPASSPPPAYLEGWSYPEAAGRWSMRHDSRIAWRLPQQWRGGVTCAIEAMTFQPPGLAAARVDIWANDRLVGSWRERHSARHARRISVRVPRQAIGDDAELVITFAVDRLRSPAQTGVGMDDPRPLGVYLRSVAIAPLEGGAAEPRRPPSPLTAFFRYRLGARGAAALAALGVFAALDRPRALRRLFRVDRWARFVDPHRPPPLHAASTPDGRSADPFPDEWADPELEGRWSLARAARLAWRLPDDARGDLDCELDAWPMRLPGEPAPAIDVYANDWHVVRWDTGPAAEYRTKPRFRIPAAALAGSALLVMTLEVQAPAGTRNTPDPRPLGVFLRRIALSPAAASASRYRPPPSRLAQRIRDRFGARNLAALAALKAFDALGRPPALRGPLRIDRWARFADPERLPAIDDAFPPATPAALDPCLEGWGLPEPGGRWTVAREARAAWRLPEGFASELDCEIAGWMLTKPGLAPPAITILANDRPIAHRAGGPDEAHTIDLRLRIPAAATRGAETLVLAFAVEPLRSPAELGLSADSRRLGIFLERVRFRRPAE